MFFLLLSLWLYHPVKNRNRQNGHLSGLGIMSQAANKMLILLQHIPQEITRDDISRLTSNLTIIKKITIVRNENAPLFNYAWIEITCEHCTQAGLNAICDVLNHRYFHNHRMAAYPVLFSHPGT